MCRLLCSPIYFVRCLVQTPVQPKLFYPLFGSGYCAAQTVLSAVWFRLLCSPNCFIAIGLRPLCSPNYFVRCLVQTLVQPKLFCPLLVQTLVQPKLFCPLFGSGFYTAQTILSSIGLRLLGSPHKLALEY